MNLIEAIQAEQDRVREALKGYYKIGRAGAFATFMLQEAIKEGNAAVASQDPVRMVRALEALKGCAE